MILIPLRIYRKGDSQTPVACLSDLDLSLVHACSQVDILVEPSALRPKMRCVFTNVGHAPLLKTHEIYGKQGIRTDAVANCISCVLEVGPEVRHAE